jgi:hypothetical protein
MADAAQQLLEEIKASPCWPLQREKSALATVRYRRALRRANRLRQPEDFELVKVLMGWEDRKPHLGVGDVPREYIHDPLPRKIGQAFADFLWSGEPQYRASTDADQPWLGLLVDENDLTARLHRAEATLIVPEGEAYLKIHTDREVAISPIITFSSRLAVTPLWKGDHLMAAAFFTEYHDQEFVEQDGKTMLTDVVWRHFEVHSDRVVRNALFKGTRSEVGKQRNLADRPETAALTETWPHGLPMLCQRWVNALDDDDPTLGVSDYDSIIDFQRTLNEARVIAAENARLTAKKRVFVTDDLLATDGSFDAGADVIATGSQGGTLGDSPNTPPVSAVEYSYDSVPLIAHTDHTMDAMLNAVGLVPQIVGRHVDGQAETGVALKVRLIPTIATGEAKAREPDSKLPLALQLAGMVDALPVAFGGFNRAYAGLSKPPTVTRDSLLPRDETEVVADNANAVNAGIRSRETAVREQWPGWSDPEIQEELDRIDGDFALPQLPESNPIEPQANELPVPKVDPATAPV